MDHEKSTFGELVENYQKRVFGVALSILRDRDEALDITQEVFMKAFRSYKDFRYDSSPETWLVKITVNKVRDHLRKEKLRRLLSAKLGPASFNHLNTIADNSRSPLEILKGKQFQASLRAFQNRLKGREREVFGLRFGNDYTIKQISEFTGISQSSVKTHLYRALDKARKHLAEWTIP